MATGDYDGTEKAKGMFESGTSVMTGFSNAVVGPSVYTPINQIESYGTAATTMYSKYSSLKESAEKATPKIARPRIHKQVHQSPGHRRLKFVGFPVEKEGKPRNRFVDFFGAQADLMGKDLRVVLTNGTDPNIFYGKPIVFGTIREEEVVIFICGQRSFVSVNPGKNIADHDQPVTPGTDPSSDPNSGPRLVLDNSFRIGLELLRRPAAIPDKTFGPEHPDFSRVFDDRKNVLARVEHRAIYCAFAISGDPDDDEATTSALTRVFSEYRRIIEDHADDLRGELSDLTFREFCGDVLRSRRRDLEKAIERISNDLRMLEDQATRKARDLHQNQKELSLLSASGLDKELRDQRRLLSLMIGSGLYEKFKIRNNRLVGITSPVTIEHEGKSYSMGQFLVSIDRGGDVEVAHLTKREKGRVIHPHIRAGERPCYGNIREAIPRLIGSERYAMVFQLLHKYLSSYNPNDKIMIVEQWADGKGPDVMDRRGPDTQPNQFPAGGAVPISGGINSIEISSDASNQYSVRSNDGSSGSSEARWESVPDKSMMEQMKSTLDAIAQKVGIPVMPTYTIGIDLAAGPEVPSVEVPLDPAAAVPAIPVAPEIPSTVAVDTVETSEAPVAVEDAPAEESKKL